MLKRNASSDVEIADVLAQIGAAEELLDTLDTRTDAIMAKLDGLLAETLHDPLHEQGQ